MSYTWNYSTGIIYDHLYRKTIDAPPEIEEFKKDILAVYEKHGLCIRPGDWDDFLFISPLGDGIDRGDTIKDLRYAGTFISDKDWQELREKHNKENR